MGWYDWIIEILLKYFKKEHEKITSTKGEKETSEEREERLITLKIALELKVINNPKGNWKRLVKGINLITATA